MNRAEEMRDPRRDMQNSPASPARMADEAVETIEMRLLVEGIFQRYGFDFRHFAPTPFKRRVRHCMREQGAQSISAFQERILYDPQCWARFLLLLSLHPKALFGEPQVYRLLREKILPPLAYHPRLRFWVAGCSSGEEVYSLAIVLAETGLMARSHIYATEMSATVLERAKQGVYARDKMYEYGENYHDAGGTKSLADYYTLERERASFHPELQQGITWAQHNLASDSSFNEFHVILCRNVLMYFDRTLQTRAHVLFYESLIPQGYLGLGAQESVKLSLHARRFEEIDAATSWYRKVR